jgi:transmembrane sensor
MKSSSMEWDKDRLTMLTLKFIHGELTLEEQMELDAWLEASPVNRQRFQQRIDPENMLKAMAIREAASEGKEVANARMNWETSVRQNRHWGRISIAAAAIIIILAGTIFLLSRRTRLGGTVELGQVAVDLPPGSNKAILTLANGSTIVLGEVQKGIIARQGHSAVVKTAGGQLLYEKEDTAAALGYNVITTPRGGQYQVQLPDGTRVWLNAGSSVRFPTAFTGARREVEMKGEAYFEVVRSARQPFIVKAGREEIKDLGTNFNVTAYDDEPAIKTTLLAGSVEIEGQILHPGQQVSMDKNGQWRLIDHADIEEAVAWKNGLFEFNGADITMVMRAISRWYDVEVKYEAQSDSHRFTGQISRDARVSEALQILATSGYHFEIKGKVVTVLP